MMRWVALVSVLVLHGCPPPARYTIERPGLPCDRAAKVAHRTLVTMGYTVTQLVEPSVERAGVVAGTKQAPDGSTRAGRVVIRCSAQGSVLQPAEDSLMPSDYEFSRTCC